MDTRLIALWFAGLFGRGTRRAHELIEIFGSPAGVRLAPSAVRLRTWSPQSRARSRPRMPPSEKPSTWTCGTPRREQTSRASEAMSS